MPALKSTTILPSIEEDAIITAAALSDTDSTPLTDEEWNRVKPAITTKQENQIAVRLSANIVAAFKATGEDWQHKIDTVLQDWLRTNAA
jgi:uncharacterized protein (DUF4415 family)